MDREQQIKKLWQTCFPNESSFWNDYYFDHIFLPENNYETIVDGKVVCSFQLIPYRLSFFASTLPVRYLVGGSTDPVYRKQGLYKELFCRACHDLFDEVSLIFLIPAQGLFTYYEKWNAVTLFFEKLEHLKMSVLKSDCSLVCKKVSDFDDEMCRFAHAAFRNRNFSVMHDSKKDLENISIELEIESGGIYVATDVDGEKLALAFVKLDNGKLVVEDLIVNADLSFRCNEIRSEFLTCLCREYDCREIIVHSYGMSDNHANPKAVARVVNARILLEQYAHAFPQETFSFYLNDELLPENRGYYSIDAGRCEFSVNQTSSDNIFTPESLLKFIFADTTTYFTLVYQ